LERRGVQLDDISIAADKGREDYVTALTLAYYAGMRIEECFTIDTSMAEKALRESKITFHGKNGRWRTVPIDENIAKKYLCPRCSATSPMY
jgi:site-specific recombinase XerD